MKVVLISIQAHRGVCCWAEVSCQGEMHSKFTVHLVPHILVGDVLCPQCLHIFKLVHHGHHEPVQEEGLVLGPPPVELPHLQAPGHGWPHPSFQLWSLPHVQLQGLKNHEILFMTVLIISEI